MKDTDLHHIEEMLTHQDQQIQELSEIALRQWRDIDLLKKHLLRLQDKIETIENESPFSEKDILSVTDIASRDKPPHY